MNDIGIFLVLLCLLATGCQGEKPPQHIIKEDVYIDLLVELQLLKTYQESLPADSVNTDSLKKKIFDAYNVTEEQFTQSHRYYQENYKEQKERIDEAIERLRMDQVKRDSTRAWGK